MKYLVTGAAGFIGSNFVRYILGNSASTVIAVDSLTYAANRASLQGLPANRLNFVKADIRDASLMEDLVADSDVVVNFAAESHNDNSISSPQVFIETNIQGAFTLLETVRKTGRRFHHISTDEVFGDLPIGSEQKFTEEYQYRPSSPYSASKAAADHLVRAWVRTFGIQATISNCSNNFGPYQHVEKFIPRQITNLILGLRPKLYGNGLNVRDWIHVDDHSSAIAMILERGEIGETYLVGANCERSNLDVAREILRIFGLPSDEFDLVADRPGHDQRYAIDASKIQRELGWKPSNRSFEEHLKTTVDWYAQNKNWWSSSKLATEQKYLEQEANWEPSLL